MPLQTRVLSSTLESKHRFKLVHNSIDRRGNLGIFIHASMVQGAIYVYNAHGYFGNPWCG